MPAKQRTRKRRSARALAMKVWNVMVPNNKDQTKSSTDGSSGDDGRTVSGTSKEGSVQSQFLSADDHSESTVDPNNDIKDVDEQRSLTTPRGLVEMHSSENDHDNVVSIDTNTEAQLQKPITITTHQQYKPDKMGPALSELDKENNSQLQTTTPNDVSRNEHADILLSSSANEDTKKAQQYITADQQVNNRCNNWSDVDVKDASFVEGTAVIIKKAHIKVNGESYQE